MPKEFVRIADVHGREAEIDALGYLVTMDIAHHMIHSADHFTAHYVDTDLDTGQLLSLVITTPNTSVRCHALFSATSTQSAQVQVFEDPTLSNVGTGLTEYNSDRNSSAVPTASVTHTATISVNGTEIAAFTIGGGSGPRSSGGSMGREAEFILKQNEQYLLLVTGKADNGVAVATIEWYEK